MMRAHGGQNRASDPLDLEWHEVVSRIWVLGTKPRSSARVLNLCTISPAPVTEFYRSHTDWWSPSILCDIVHPCGGGEWCSHRLERKPWCWKHYHGQCQFLRLLRHHRGFHRRCLETPSVLTSPFTRTPVPVPSPFQWAASVAQNSPGHLKQEETARLRLTSSRAQTQWSSENMPIGLPDNLEWIIFDKF